MDDTFFNRISQLAKSWEQGDEEFGATERERNRTAMLRAIVDETASADA